MRRIVVVCRVCGEQRPSYWSEKGICAPCYLKEREEAHKRATKERRKGGAYYCSSQEARWRQQGIRGMTCKVYEQMLAAQDGKCYLCGAAPGTRSLAVDHDHTTGKPRRLLCSRCNTTLGFVERYAGSSWLDGAQAYLLEFE